jgi:hypothetical protein
MFPLLLKSKRQNYICLLKEDILKDEKFKYKKLVIKKIFYGSTAV